LQAEGAWRRISIAEPGRPDATLERLGGKGKWPKCLAAEGLPVPRYFHAPSSIVARDDQTEVSL
jgi:hypothetical protein